MIMKKGIFLLAAAAAAFASCTQSEVMEVAENRAIGFSSFVGKPTKMVTSVTGLSDGQYYVFGNYGDGSGTWDGQAFNNEINTAIYYWQTGKTYRFGAYADGAGGKLDNTEVSFSAADKKLTFTNYTPNDSKDLVVAATGDVAANDYTGGTTAVPLTFNHMLSQVKLTFTTDAAATYKLTITNVKINNAITTCTGTYNGAASWEASGTTGDYEYTEFGSTGQVISKEAPANQVKLVIPQGSTDGLSVTFTATIKGEKPTGTSIHTKNFTATLGHNLNTSPNTGNGIFAALADNTWSAGYCYNYTAQIDIEDIVDNATSLVPITFNPSVEDWKDTGNTTVTPNPVPNP